MIHFCVTHYQNFNFCQVKSHSSYYSLSNSVTKTKMMKLIVTINSENVERTISVEQIISIGRIATYLKIVPQQANMIVAHIDISKIYFFYLCFVSRTFTNHRTTGEGGGHSINSSLPLPSASKTLRHYPGDYCRELTSAHSQQPDSNRELNEILEKLSI